jgi:hypothetical protein
MMRKRFFIVLVTLLAVELLVPVSPARASGAPPGDDGIVIWNEDYTLQEGERLEGDLIVFNGDVTLEPGSHVKGSVILWNGSAEVAGTVEDDLVVSGGDIALESSARVQGDVVCSWSCDLEREEGARVEGGVTTGVPLPEIPALPGIRIPQLPPAPLTSWANGAGRALDWVFRLIRSIAVILVVAIVAGLVALIWPEQVTQVGETVVAAPGPSLGIGLLTLIAATALVVALAITICLSPIAALVALALGAAGLFGWLAVGTAIGDRALQALNVRESTPLWAAGLGTLLITMVSVGLRAAFCLAPLGWLLIFTLGSAGLGAVVLTRFGTTAYAPGAAPEPGPSVPAPPAPEVPEPIEAPRPPEPPGKEVKGDEA